MGAPSLFVNAVARGFDLLEDVPGHARYAASFECQREPFEIGVYLEPLSPGERLPAVPLFLAPGVAVDLALEPTCEQTLDHLSRKDRERLGRSEGGV